jgi:hypothetical protein
VSAPAFTPGPWGIFEKDERVVVAVGQIGEDDICEPLGDTPEQAEANAYLIAAAPELYEAVLDLLMTDDGDLPSSHAVAVVRAKSVLAKARGEQ